MSLDEWASVQLPQALTSHWAALLKWWWGVWCAEICGGVWRGRVLATRETDWSLRSSSPLPFTLLPLPMFDLFSLASVSHSSSVFILFLYQQTSVPVLNCSLFLAVVFHIWIILYSLSLVYCYLPYFLAVNSYSIPLPLSSASNEPKHWYTSSNTHKDWVYFPSLRLPW